MAANQVRCGASSAKLIGYDICLKSIIDIDCISITALSINVQSIKAFLSTEKFILDRLVTGQQNKAG